MMIFLILAPYGVFAVLMLMVSAVTSLFTAAALGAVFCALAWRLRQRVTAASAGLTFHFSLLYLALLFVAVAAGAALG